MPFEKVTPKKWKELVTTQVARLDDPMMRKAINTFDLVPRSIYSDEFGASFLDGSLAAHTDFSPPAQLSAFAGNLSVHGKLSTADIEGIDGNATLIIFGDVQCRSLVNDWASIIIVTGNLIVEDWVFACREDSSLLVGGDFKTPIFVGADIWASVGGVTEIEYGYGYTIDFPLLDAYGAKQNLPKRNWRELAMKLGLSGQQLLDETDLIIALESRLSENGSILSPT